MSWFGSKNKKSDDKTEKPIPKLDKKQDTFIGPRITITGDISGRDSVRILGKVKGKISLEDDLIVEESGKIETDSISARNVVVSGKINGSVMAKEKLHLRPTANITGNIDNPRLVVEDGAIFKGNCDMPERKKASNIPPHNNI